MAVEQGKVIAKLNKLFEGKSVTDTYKKSLAAKWAARIETDEDIDAFVKDREEDVLEASKEADRRATSAVQVAKEAAAKTVLGEEQKPVEVQTPSDAPEYVKALMAKIEGLTTTVNTLQAAKQTESIAEKFNKDQRVKDVPDWIREGFMPTSDADYEDKVTALATKFNTFAEQNKIASFGNDKPTTVAGVQPTGKVKEATDEDVKAVMAQI